jgi:two-component system response regulator
MSNPHALSVLYAEDDPDDRLLARLAHRDSGALNPLVFVDDGEEALAYLRCTGPYLDAATIRPGIVLLDLNMPGIGGLETLRVMRADPDLRRIPVVILTTSTAAADITSSYEAGANSYIVKPAASAKLVDLFRSLCAYWFEIGSLSQEISR